jgi:hypothetical protein
MSKKKPLHHKPWFRSSGVKALFETLTPADIAAQMVHAANTGDTRAAEWLARFVGVPKAKAPLEALIDASADVHLVMSPVLTRDRRLKWTYGYLPSKGHGDTYALAMLRVIEGNMLRRIKHCALPECRRLFFGDVRAKWCSETCGSKARVRAKRKRDRQ